MTLCILWKEEDRVCFSSDSRLTLAKHSYADVGIKVLSVPYNIFAPEPKKTLPGEPLSFHEPTKPYLSGELGMCFAGSAINSLVLKEAIIEGMKYLYVTKGFTVQKLEKLAELIFQYYKDISKSLCETSIGKNGIAEIFISGSMEDDKKLIKTFRLSTDLYNQHCFEEILKENGDYYIAGSGKEKAEKIFKENTPKTRDHFLDALTEVINDNSIDDVGGFLQYGTFKKEEFIIYVPRERNTNHMWRAGINVNSNDHKQWRGFSVIYPTIGIPDMNSNK